MRVLVTGANGFIGNNLTLRLEEEQHFVIPFVRGDVIESLPSLINDAEAVIHLAGENRPSDEKAFENVNIGLTTELCNAIKHEFEKSGRKVPLIFTSSTQAEFENPYGISKRIAEDSIKSLVSEIHSSAAIFRLPGVFGKWCKPNYNSVVATFCHNMSRDLQIHINDPERSLRLVYVDDVISTFIKYLNSPSEGLRYETVDPEYKITLAQLAGEISSFKECRESLLSKRVGCGLTRALYSTYTSYLPADNFSYSIPKYTDERGSFVEMLKTADSGQFSFFTAHPGVTRGGHYHHTKTEKFLVVKGEALFRFRHILTNESFELKTSSEKPTIVDTIPGWAHDITNVGDDEMIVMLWANEVFDPEKPDTITCKVSQ